MNPVRMLELTAVWAGCPVKARPHFPVTDTVSGEELQSASLVSPKLSTPDTPQTSELAATQGVCAVTSTVKVLPRPSLGKFSVTEEPGSADDRGPARDSGSCEDEIGGRGERQAPQRLLLIVVRYLEGIDVAGPRTGGHRIGGGSDNVAFEPLVLAYPA